jgi:hypothetical protein
MSPTALDGEALTNSLRGQLKGFLKGNCKQNKKAKFGGQVPRKAYEATSEPSTWPLARPPTTSTMRSICKACSEAYGEVNNALLELDDI